MERKYEVGQTVKFTDAYGKVHNALVCAWHVGYGDAQKHKELRGEPSINIVFVTDDNYSSLGIYTISRAHSSLPFPFGRKFGRERIFQ